MDYALPNAARRGELTRSPRLPIFDSFLFMAWLERKIRRYEHRRWTVDDNRRVLPFEWGLEHIGGQADDPEPRAFLNPWVDRTLASSDEWFRSEPANDYRLHPPENSRQDGRVLTFTSAVRSPWPENNLVRARLFAARSSGPAVVLLPQWNAKWDGQVALCRWLNRMGITVLRLSMPYHDRRAIPGHDRADYLVGPNIGLTLQANRQAVLDVRSSLLWLAHSGYGRLGIVGTSIGSAIGCITLAHDPLVCAGAFLHVSTYFADVVRTGMNTSHVWEGLRAKVSGDELRRFWSPISPSPYIPRLRGSTQKMLMVSGRYDPTFLPEFSNEIIRNIQAQGIEQKTLIFPCGHYSLELWPFGYTAALQMGWFLFRNLA
jgi:hypothetical protein